MIAGINTAISLIYYLRVAKTVCIDPEPERAGPVSIGLLPAAYVLVVSLPVLIYGIFPARILEIAAQATQATVDVAFRCSLSPALIALSTSVHRMLLRPTRSTS